MAHSARMRMVTLGVIGILAVSLGVGERVVRTSPTTLVSAQKLDPRTIGFALPADVYWSSAADTRTELDLAASTTRNGAIRLPIGWGLIQPYGPETFNWSVVDRLVRDAAERRLSMVATVVSTPAWAAAPGSAGPYAEPANLTDFGRFLRALATRYAGKIAAYEIWNEPNSGLFYSPVPDVVSYTALLTEGYRAVKSVDPGAEVVGGSLISVADSGRTADPVEFLRRMYELGAGGNFDALSFHPYKYDLSLADAWTTANSPGEQLSNMRRLMIANGDGDKKIWATEFGIPTAEPGSDGRQNAMIGAFLAAWRELPYGGPVLFYTLRDRNSGNGIDEDNFGVLRTDYSAKDAMWTIFGDRVLGVPTSPEYRAFTREKYDSAWGQVLSPVVPLTNSGTYGRFFENAIVYLASSGTRVSPSAAATRLIALNTYPVSDLSNGTQQLANGSRLFFSPLTGAHVVGPGVLGAWSRVYGLALTDEIPQGDLGVKVTFQHGYITWTPQGGAVGTLR